MCAGALCLPDQGGPRTQARVTTKGRSTSLGTGLLWTPGCPLLRGEQGSSLLDLEGTDPLPLLPALPAPSQSSCALLGPCAAHSSAEPILGARPSPPSSRLRASHRLLRGRGRCSTSEDEAGAICGPAEGPHSPRGAGGPCLRGPGVSWRVCALEQCVCAPVCAHALCLRV